MSRIRCSRTATAVALLVLASGLLLPAEHVHYAPHGDRASVVHRHLSPHGSGSAALHGPEDSGHVQELREAWLAGRPFVFSPMAAVALSPWDDLPHLAARESAVVAALRIDHGPPLRSDVLRGPPASS